MPHDSYFQGNPTRLDISRSLMTARPRWSGSWVVGKLFPIFATSLVLPADTFSVSVASAIRMIRPVVPVMDDMEITIEAYFVPHRLVMSRKSMSPDLNDFNHSWQAFIGAQDSLLNMPTPSDVKLPALLVETGSYVIGGLGDCLGYHIPQGTNGSYWVNPLKALAFYSVWNEYFREPSTRNPVTYSVVSDGVAPGGYRLAFTGSDAGISSGNYSIGTFTLPPVSRYHGYFGSALPWPQRNSTQVELPLGADAPVFTGSVLDDDYVKDKFGNLKWATLSTGLINQTNGPIQHEYNGSGDWTSIQSGSTGTSTAIVPANLYADLSQATAATVNQFRLAVQTQRWYEALARSGNKYSDLIHGMFGVRGVSIPDRPEYLGGFTAPIYVSQVASTNAATGGDLGEVGAFSLSNPGGFLFSKSFTEHGTIMIVACCRVRDSFTQGIAREDQKFDRLDYYWPQFANLGEQKLLKKELYVDGSSGNTTDESVFGYQEAWAEYRMFVDQVTGYLNPSASASIAAYTYANYFSSAPDLKGFLNAENQVDNVDRTLSVKHNTAGFQLFGQFEFDIKMVRPMPTYSIPGLVDHH